MVVGGVTVPSAAGAVVDVAPGAVVVVLLAAVVVVESFGALALSGATSTTPRHMTRVRATPLRRA